MLAVFALSWGGLVWNKGLHAGVWTVFLSGTIWLLYRAVQRHKNMRVALGYAVFFITPLLTSIGQIQVLTGWRGTPVSVPWFGVSFVTASLALYIVSGRLSARELWLNVLQPARWNSGPCALPSDITCTSRRTARKNIKSIIYIGWIILGIFFYSVVASGLAPFLVLKESLNAVDIVVFSAIFEAYVYFNFAGISLMAFGLLNLADVRTVRNFRTPFAARDLIGYWQSWHISLSLVLKDMFFKPIRSRFGLHAAVLVAFSCSALWHGVSFNFAIWGLFHGTAWLLTYTLAGYGRLGRWVNFLMFPAVVILGRLIFSESSTELLGMKLQQLLHFDHMTEAWTLHLQADARTLASLALAGLLIGAEVLLPKRYSPYKMLRKKWGLVVLIGAVLAMGTTNTVGIYGTR